jgi:hypothetical protein
MIVICDIYITNHNHICFLICDVSVKLHSPRGDETKVSRQKNFYMHVVDFCISRGLIYTRISVNKASGAIGMPGMGEEGRKHVNMPPGKKSHVMRYLKFARAYTPRAKFWPCHC